MFKRKLEVKLVKDDPKTAIVPGTHQIHVSNVNLETLEPLVKKTVIVVTTAMVVKKVVTTGCKIAEIYASK